MKSRLDKSIEYIRGYCLKHYCCEECELYNNMEAKCTLKKLPLNWKTPKEREQKGGTE